LVFLILLDIISLLIKYLYMIFLFKLWLITVQYCSEPNSYLCDKHSQNSVSPAYGELSKVQINEKFCIIGVWTLS